MALPTLVYALLLLIEAGHAFDYPLSVDVLREGSVEEKLTVEQESTFYLVRDQQSRERRMEIERSALYGHIFFVFAPDFEAMAVDMSPILSLLVESRRLTADEIELTTPEAGGWTLLFRDESVIVTSRDEPLFLNARPTATPVR